MEGGLRTRQGGGSGDGEVGLRGGGATLPLVTGARPLLFSCDEGSWPWSTGRVKPDPTEILWDVQEVPLSIQPQAWVTVLALCLFPPLTELVRLALSPQPAGRGAELDFVPLPGML